MRTINGIDELKAAEGEELGTSDWHEVTQEDVNAFADVTGDHQWIHVDVEKAKETPFGGTIAHGFYTLSLAVPLVRGDRRLPGLRVRAQLRPRQGPLPVAAARGLQAARLLEDRRAWRTSPAASQVTTQMTFEREGGDKPVCVAESLVRLYG